jgi:hypothetical protein
MNGSTNVREVGGFGTLRDSTVGLSWSPVPGVQLLAGVRRSAAAPDQAQQSTPAISVENASVFDHATGRTEVVTLMLGGNPDLAAERRLVRSLAFTVRPFAKRELRLGATYEATIIRNQTGVVQAVTPLTEAMLPEQFTRDSAGRLVSVSYRPINFAVERQRTLNLTLNASGRLGGEPPPPAPGTKAPPQPRPNYYAGLGPSIKLRDRLQLRPGAPVLDLLAGDTIRGWGMPSVYGYAFGGINHGGSGLTFNAWYQAPDRIRAAGPESELRFSSIFKLNVGGYVGLGRLLPDQRWARALRVGVDVTNATDARQRVLDADGMVPNRFQPDYLDPTGRMVTFTLRKLL